MLLFALAILLRIRMHNQATYVCSAFLTHLSLLHSLVLYQYVWNMYVRTCTYNSCHFVMLQCAIHWSFTVTHWATNSGPKGFSSAVLPTVHVHRAEVGSLSSSTTLITWACTCRCVVVSHDWVLGGACEFVCMCVCLHTLQVRDKTIVWESHCSTEWYCHIR